jgi:outer membrane receptor protein involved in Fe transport
MRRRPYHRRAFLLMLLVVLALAAIAADASAEQEAPADVKELMALSIEELMTIEVDEVFSASKYRQKVNEAPSSVTIVTSEDIRRHGYRTVADILNGARGFFTTYDRNYTYVGVRGFALPGDYTTRILLMVDGHRINDNIYDNAATGTDFILDVDLIDRVEVSRGPGSSLWGSNAFFAVVNVVSRSGRNLKGTELSGEAGSFNTYKGRVSYGASAKTGLDAIISATGYRSSGDRLYFPEYDERNALHAVGATNNGYSDNCDFDRYGSVFTKIAAQNVTIAAAYVERTKGIPTGVYGIDFNNPANKTTDQQGYVDMQYNRAFGSSVEMTGRVFYDYYHYAGDYLYSGVDNRDSSNGSSWGGEARLGLRTGGSHRIILGAEYQGNLRQDQKNADVDPFVLYFDDQRRSRIWAAYVQDEIMLSPSLLMNAGLRYDHTSTFGGTTNPRLAAIWRAGDASTFKLIYGRAFRAPSVYELYYEAPASTPPIVANPGLRPEKIDTYEAVYEHSFDPQVRASISAYSYRIQDLIVQSTDPLGVSTHENLDEVEGKGIEIEVEKRWNSGLQGRFSYALQQAVNVKTDVTLPNSPEHLAKVTLSLPLIKDRVLFGVEELYTGKRKMMTDAYLPSVATTNVTFLLRNASRSLELSASVYNLFDAKYADPVPLDFVPLYSVQQDGRTFRMKLTYAF